MSVLVPGRYLAEFDEPSGYLDFARFGPPSRPVAGAREAALAATLRFEGDLVAPLAAARDRALDTTAGLLGCRPDQVTFVPNTSSGLFSVAFGLRQGTVLVPRGEFPANTYPWLRNAEAGGAQVVWIDAEHDRITPDIVRRYTDGSTAAMTVSAVDYRTGFRPDLAGIREALGPEPLLVVDGIQGFGAVDLSLEPADVLVAGGQKWLRAGWGAALLALGDRALERVAPVLGGWSGVEDAMGTAPVPHAPLTRADRYTQTNIDLYATAAFGAAVDLLADVTPRAVEAGLLDRVRAVEEVIRRRDGEVCSPWRHDGERAGILTFRLPAEPVSETVERLAKAGITAADRAGWVRVSPHATTGDDTIALFAGTL